MSFESAASNVNASLAYTIERTPNRDGCCGVERFFVAEKFTAETIGNKLTRTDSFRVYDELATTKRNGKRIVST